MTSDHIERAIRLNTAGKSLTLHYEGLKKRNQGQYQVLKAICESGDPVPREIAEHASQALQIHLSERMSATWHESLQEATRVSHYRNHFYALLKVTRI